MKKSVKFLFAGGFNTLLTFLLYAVLVGNGWNFNIALVVAYILGILLGFCLNMLWTFKLNTDSKITGKYSKFGKYLLVYLLVFMVNFAVLNLLVAYHIFGAIWGQLVAITVATLFSFILQNSWVFKPADD